MISDELLNPFNVDPRHEFPHEPEEKDNWTECYYFFANNTSSGYSVSIHYARESTDTDIWRVLLGVYLPDGGLLVGRYFGRDANGEGDKMGPGAGPMQARCVEPFRRWELTFDGLLEVSNASASTHQLHRNGVVQVTKFNLVFEGASPIWDLGASDLSKGFVFTEDGKEENKSHHWEQIGKVTGSLTVAGQEMSFNGVGNRDHSYGPRDYTHLESSMWINALFPSGKSIMLMGTRVGGHYIHGGYIFRNDGSPLEVVRLTSAPVGEGNDTPDNSLPANLLFDPELKSFKAVIQTAAGEEFISGEMTHTMASTNFCPNHELMGTDLDLDEHGCQFSETAVTYTWGDEVGAGHFERISQLRHLRVVEDMK